jgi:hypothetical protein
MSVTWNKAALAGGQHRYTDVKSEHLKLVIANDLAFLAAHPVRHKNSEAVARRRRFNEAMAGASGMLPHPAIFLMRRSSRR